MNQNVSFVRKIVYLAIIVALLLPLFLLGQPATQQAEGSSRGGMLANMRLENDLSQASLGEIDPASESMKLASLGMSGVATNILWTKANEYKKTQQFDKLSATLNQISKLQPNFIKVWEAQSHNLSYNVSVEFDNYEHRYAWVKKGMYFLMDGVDKNRHEPRLTHYMGWFVSQKIGRSDEHVQFRRLFRRDRDFHKDLSVYVPMDTQDVLGPDQMPDNWLVGRQWYMRAYDQVEKQGDPIRGKSPLIFYASGPMSRINFVTTIEEEGYLDEQAAEAWEVALAEWKRYGLRQIPTSWGHNIQLEKYEETLAEKEQLEAEFKELAPGLWDEIREEKIAKLPEDARQALEMPAEERNEQQYMLAYGAGLEVRPTYREVAARVESDKRSRAKGLARRIEELEQFAEHIDRYRNIVNYLYWRTLCEVERQDIAIAARKHLYDAEKYRAEADLFRARDEYNQAWDLWAQIYDEYPLLLEDTTSRDLVDIIEKKYMYVLGQLDEDLPRNFKLKKLLEIHNSELASRVDAAPSDSEPAPPTDESTNEADAKPTETASPPSSPTENSDADTKSPKNEAPNSDDAPAEPKETDGDNKKPKDAPNDAPTEKSPESTEGSESDPSSMEPAAGSADGVSPTAEGNSTDSDSSDPDSEESE
ncbi:MAG: hypothetical protein KDA59_06235 [Planctomycetales bacterium]|nr:hypothetical protein [Planctomycetales bacterium]